MLVGMSRYITLFLDKRCPCWENLSKVRFVAFLISLMWFTGCSIVSFMYLGSHMDSIEGGGWYTWCSRMQIAFIFFWIFSFCWFVVLFGLYIWSIGNSCMLMFILVGLCVWSSVQLTFSTIPGHTAPTEECINALPWRFFHVGLYPAIASGVLVLILCASSRLRKEADGKPKYYQEC